MYDNKINCIPLYDFIKYVIFWHPFSIITLIIVFITVAHAHNILNNSTFGINVVLLIDIVSAVRRA